MALRPEAPSRARLGNQGVQPHNRHFGAKGIPRGYPRPLQLLGPLRAGYKAGVTKRRHRAGRREEAGKWEEEEEEGEEGGGGRGAQARRAASRREPPHSRRAPLLPLSLPCSPLRRSRGARRSPSLLLLFSAVAPPPAQPPPGDPRAQRFPALRPGAPSGSGGP